MVLAVAAVVWFVLLRRYGGQGAQVQLDVIRTAGTLVISTGGGDRIVYAGLRLWGRRSRVPSRAETSSSVTTSSRPTFAQRAARVQGRRSRYSRGAGSAGRESRQPSLTNL